MTSDQIAKAAAPWLAEIGKRINELAAEVAELKVIEQARIQQAYLAAWNHRGIAPNGHGRNLNG